MKNIHILPTDKSSRLTIMEGKLLLSDSVSWESKPIDWEYGDGINQHIYITSDEKIRDGDWFMSDFNSFPLHNVKELSEREGTLGWKKEDLKYNLKIILTTDQDLIKDGVQAIDDDFLEWFVKNPSCEWVKVRKNPKVHFIVKGKGVKGFNQGYKIIIPKEENSIEAKQRAKNYMSLKGALEPKQETLEEASQKFAYNYFEMNEINHYKALKQGFVAGAKWQQVKTEIQQL